MIKVKLSTPNKQFPIVRQTPLSSGIWEDIKFYVNEEVEECDYWVVCDNLKEQESTRCLKENTILITGEPPSVKNYNRPFVKQFGAVISCEKGNINHVKLICSQQALPWMAGLKFITETKQWDINNYKDYNDLTLGLENVRNDKIAVITSNKKLTKGHKDRLKFIDELKKTLGDKFDIYGEGFEPVADKLEVIRQYKYMLVIENSNYNNYWTEKLSDTFLGEAYPIYYGCPNIYDYFSADSLSVIDIYNPEDSIAQIVRIMNGQKYAMALNHVQDAKKLVLNKYNVFALIKSLIDSNFSKSDVERSVYKISPQKTSKIRVGINFIKQYVTTKF